MIRSLLHMLHGPLIWIFHFGLIYFAAGFGAALGFARPGIQLFCWIATFLAAFAVIVLLWSTRGNISPTAAMGRSLAQLSLVAILLQALVLRIVPL